MTASARNKIVDCPPLPLPRFITRLDHGSTHGYWVRIQRRVFGKAYTKFFADKKWGGAERALGAAVDFIASIESQIPKKLYADRRPKEGGYGYVRRGTVKYKSKSDGTLKTYEAFIPWYEFADGQRAMTKYSIPKWGEQDAKHKAELWLGRQRAKNRQLAQKTG